MLKVNERSYLLFAITVVLVGLNLRPIMAAIGPVLDMIQNDSGIGDVSAGLLTTLPVFAMGLFAFFGGLLQRTLGAERTVLCSLIALGVASLARLYFHGATGLIVTAAMGGVGIALIQAVIPGIIKRDHSDKAAQLMALYTVGIMGGAMLASSLVAPMSVVSSWPLSLAVWGALAIIALISWLIVSASPSSADSKRGTRLPIASGRAWFLLIFFGIGTSAYTLVLAWLPPFYVQLGWSGTASGLLLGGLTLAEVIAAVGLTSIIHRFPDRRPVLYTILVMISFGLASLIIAPEALVIPGLLLLGLGIGGLFPMSLIIAMDHLEKVSQASALMGFVQGGGYIIASFMPFIAGLLRGVFDDLTMAWIIMLVGIFIQLLMVSTFAPNHSLSSEDWSLKKTAVA
ncbi:MAG: MFS transporter [Oleiphilaceae bacterium]|uniref:MFS transporter n=2 Tax=Marinobacter sp. TaxID=50741 RepID=UPI003F9A90B2